MKDQNRTGHDLTGHDALAEVRRTRRNNKTKAAIGLLLLVVLAYVVFTNFDFADWPFIGMVIKGPSDRCVETRGPKIMTDTVVEQLQVEDEGIDVLRDEDRALIKVENVDSINGYVKVTLFCRDGNEQGTETKDIVAGGADVFVFDDVDDCDLDYIIEPEVMTSRVNRTVYVSESECE